MPLLIGESLIEWRITQGLFRDLLRILPSHLRWWKALGRVYSAQSEHKWFDQNTSAVLQGLFEKLLCILQDLLWFLSLRIMDSAVGCVCPILVLWQRCQWQSPVLVVGIYFISKGELILKARWKPLLIRNVSFRFLQWASPKNCVFHGLAFVV